MTLFARAHPERATAIVLSSSPGGLRTPATDANLARLSRLGPGDLRGVRPAELGFFYQQLGTIGAVPDGMALLLQLAGVEVDPAPLCAARIPMLVLSGDEDDIVPTTLAREVLGVVSHAELHVLPGVGHSLLLEAPSAANAVVAAFLARAAKARAPLAE